jgi:hypothetical protein
VEREPSSTPKLRVRYLAVSARVGQPEKAWPLVEDVILSPYKPDTQKSMGGFSNLLKMCTENGLCVGEPNFFGGGR